MQPGGWDAIRRQERFIAAAGGGLALLPAGGCPGPAVVDVAQVVRLVALDTQWWLQEGPKPAGPTSSCPASSESAVIDSVRAALRTAGQRVVVVVAHHPPASGGVHGGHFGWQDHIFPLRNIKPWLWIPLPLIGSVSGSRRRSRRWASPGRQRPRRRRRPGRPWWRERTTAQGGCIACSWVPTTATCGGHPSRSRCWTCPASRAG